MLSRSCEYGLVAAARLASMEEDSYVPIHELCDGLELSHHYLTKVLQVLTREGIMKSMRGPNGGVALNCRPCEVTLKDIVVAIDGPQLFETCVLGLPGCGEQKPCPLHEQWSTVRSCVHAAFEETTLDEVAGAPDGTYLWMQSLNGTVPDSFRDK